MPSRTRKPRTAPRPLKFDDSDRAPPRAGDPVDPEKLRTHLPKVRERFAGRTEGEVTLGEPTADDLAREVLLDDDPSHTPAALRRRVPADTELTVVGAEHIGAGGGLDEAEDAEADAIDESEHRQLQRRAARAGGKLGNFEPHEAAAGNPGRERNHRKR